MRASTRCSPCTRPAGCSARWTVHRRSPASIRARASPKPWRTPPTSRSACPRSSSSRRLSRRPSPNSLPPPRFSPRRPRAWFRRPSRPTPPGGTGASWPTRSTLSTCIRWWRWSRLRGPRTMSSTRPACSSRGAGLEPVRLNREIDGFLVNRLQGALLQEAFRLVAEGVATAADVDTAVRSGLAPRWSFMGPFETIDLNAPIGIADYVERYEPMYRRLASQQREIADWSSGPRVGPPRTTPRGPPPGRPGGAAGMARSSTTSTDGRDA